MVAVSIREEHLADTQATRLYASAAFKVYIECIGELSALMPPDFEPEIKGELGGGLIQYETEKNFYNDTLAVRLMISKGGGIGGY